MYATHAETVLDGVQLPYDNRISMVPLLTFYIYGLEGIETTRFRVYPARQKGTWKARKNKGEKNSQQALPIWTPA